MKRTCLGVVYAGNVVHATRDEEDAVGGPGQVVDFGADGPAHGLDPPCLLVFEALLEVGVRCLVLRRHPQQDVAIVARAGEQFTCPSEQPSLCNGERDAPRGHHRTTLTAWVCLTSVERYVTLRSSPWLSTFQSCVSQPLLRTSTCSLSYPDVVVASSCCESSLAVGLEVGRVDGCVLVVPGHQKRSSPHDERSGGSPAGPSAWECGFGGPRARRGVAS